MKHTTFSISGDITVKVASLLLVLQPLVKPALIHGLAPFKVDLSQLRTWILAFCASAI